MERRGMCMSTVRHTIWHLSHQRYYRLANQLKRSFLAAARHAFSERGIQNNRAEGRGDHTGSSGFRNTSAKLPPAGV